MTVGAILRNVISSVLLLTAVDVQAAGLTTGDAWVTADRLNRRTCPDTSCGIVGWLGFREKATVLEIDGGWARITKPYDASCRNGKSEYVDSGNAACTPGNGIVGGQFAEWVATTHLNNTRPADPSAAATGDYALVRGSDDYRIHKDIFAKKARQLIDSGKCTSADFQNMGGWVASTNKGRGIYFTYCGGMRASNRVYLDVQTGAIFR